MELCQGDNIPSPKQTNQEHTSRGRNKVFNKVGLFKTNTVSSVYMRITTFPNIFTRGYRSYQMLLIQDQLTSPSKFLTGTIFLHAHLQAVYYNCVKFHKNPMSRLGGVAFTSPSLHTERIWVIFKKMKILCDIEGEISNWTN